MKARDPKILGKINGKPRPPTLPKSRMGKWRVFALRAASSLIWWDGGLLFHFTLSKIVGRVLSSVLGYDQRQHCERYMNQLITDADQLCDEK